MADREKGRIKGQLTTPEDTLTSSPSRSDLPSGDYSYTVELVASIHNQLGKLTEAVEALKDQSKSHSTKIGDIGKDVHTAKIILGIVGAVLLVFLAAYAKHLFDKM